MKPLLSSFSFIVVCLSLLFIFTSCNELQTRYEDAGYGNSIVSQKHEKDTEWLYGVVWGVNHHSVIPVIYNKMSLDFAFLGFIAEKDGIRYAFNSKGRDLLAPDTYISHEELGYNLYYGECFRKDFCWKIKGKRGTYFYSALHPEQTIGPYEDIQPGSRGFMYKENGKWGYQNMIRTNKGSHDKGNIPAHYNAIIELTEYGVNSIRLLVKDNKQWKVLSPDGSLLRNVTDKEIAHIRKIGKEYTFLNTNRIVEYNNNHKTPEQKRIGTAEAARICIKRTYSINKSVFDPSNTVYDNPVPFENPY